MYYKVIEDFWPSHHGWKSYIDWRGLKLDSFDSVDGILCPDLFEPKSEDDWNNCVNENYKLSLITNLSYAKKTFNKYKNASLVGVEIELETDYKPKEDLLGFDIIDGYCDVSLLTNWGIDEEDVFSHLVQRNGLIRDLDSALRTKNTLRERCSEDSHAEECEVWGIYKINT